MCFALFLRLTTATLRSRTFIVDTAVMMSEQVGMSDFFLLISYVEVSNNIRKGTGRCDS